MERRTTLRVAIPSGIGDSLWSLTKIQDIMQLGGYSSCAVSLQETNLNRGADFVEHFDFVQNANYEKFPIQYTADYFAFLNDYDFDDYQGAIPDDVNTILLVDRGLALLNANYRMDKAHLIEETGEYIYIESQKNFLRKYDWLLIANGHLERGNRIETWLPQFKTNLDIGLNNFVFTEAESRKAEKFHHELLNDAPFVALYLGPKSGNTSCGYNRNSLWTLDNWYTLIKLMKEHNPELKFVIVGARYDMEYVLDFLEQYLEPFFVNLTGLTEIAVTFAIIKQSQFFISYPCGLGIFSVYLGVPTACFWRPYGDSVSADIFISVREEMSTAWVPDWAMKNYLPLFYTRCSPDSIAENCINRRWI